MEIRINMEVILKRVDGLVKIVLDIYVKVIVVELEWLCEWLLKCDGGCQDKICMSLVIERVWWLNFGNSYWRFGGDGDRKGKKYYMVSDIVIDESGDDDDD